MRKPRAKLSNLFVCFRCTVYIYIFAVQVKDKRTLEWFFFSNHCRPFSSVVVTSKAYGSSLSVLWWNCSPVINIVFNVVHFVTFAVDCINVKCYLRYCSMWNEQMLIKTHFASWNGWGNLWHRWGKCSKGMFVGAKSIHWVSCKFLAAYWNFEHPVHLSPKMHYWVGHRARHWGELKWLMLLEGSRGSNCRLRLRIICQEETTKVGGLAQ